MTKITKAELYTLNNEFQRFRNGFNQARKHDKDYFIVQVKKFEKKYKKAGLEKNFAEILFSFAEQMRKNGIPDFPGMIYSTLIKMPFLTYERKEVFIINAIDFAREQNDPMHTLARIVDLKILYKQQEQSHKYTQTLFEEEKVLIQICNNFKRAQKNFRTHVFQNSPLKKYQLQLAKVRVDIAKVLIKKEPHRAKAILLKARPVFQNQEHTKEVDFVDTLLSELE